VEATLTEELETTVLTEDLETQAAGFCKGWSKFVRRRETLGLRGEANFE